MRAIAILVSLSLIGCFPHDAHKRTLAKYAEGGALLAGIGLEYAANSQADCDQMKVAGMADGSCGTKGAVIGDLGVGLMLAGLVGFIVTVSTSEEDSPPPPVTTTTVQKPMDAVKAPALR